MHKEEARGMSGEKILIAAVFVLGLITVTLALAGRTREYPTQGVLKGLDPAPSLWSREGKTPTVGKNPLCGIFQQMRVRFVFWSIFVLCGLVVSPSMAASAPECKGSLRVMPFDYHGVTLEDGDLKRQFDEVRWYYLRILNDDLVKPFRIKAGLPAPGADLGGWYIPHKGHIFGQLISGLSRMYAASGDERCREKAQALIQEYMKCLSPEGAGNFDAKGHYNYDKMVGGLVDNYVYCGDTDALDWLSRITDWAIENLDRSRPYGDNGTEWYTLSENLYRAYLVTGDPKYRDFAQVWEYTEYWEMHRKGVDILSKKPEAGLYSEYLHSYSHVNTLCGAAMAYEVTGDRRYLETLLKAYDSILSTQVFVTGGFGPWFEHFLPRHMIVQSIVGDRHDSSENHCDSWAVFKLSKYLLMFTGDARYMDWAERALYNMTGANIPMSGDGQIMYYSSYNANWRL